MVVIHYFALGEEEVMASSMAYIERMMAAMALGCSLSYWTSFKLR